MQAGRRFGWAASLGLIPALFLGLAGKPLRAQSSFKISISKPAPNGTVTITFPAGSINYYTLHRGTNVTNFSAVKMRLGTNGTASFSDSQIAQTNSSSFYRVLCAPVNQPLDQDSDGIDDVYELSHPSILNPFDAADAAQDPDLDGLSNLGEYLGGNDPTKPPVIFTTNTLISCANTNFEGRDIVVSGATVTFQCEHSFNSLVVTNGGVLTHVAGLNPGLRLLIAHNAFIDATSRADADGIGYPVSSGPGAGNGDFGGGGGYGGTGGNGNGGIGGPSYGLILEPTDLGSGGGNGAAGGGAVRIEVSGVFRLDGVMTANGANAFNGGGGSGGSAYVNAGIFTGSGVVHANGGSGANNGNTMTGGGGGSGGRVAIYFETNTFSGTVSAHGAAGFVGGAAGTILTKQYPAQQGTIRIDNGGLTGATTEFINETIFDTHFRVSGGAIVGPPVGHIGFELIILGDCIVESGAFISATGRGAGPGAGVAPGSFGTRGGGGGYGGAGGNGNGGGSTGGGTYGSEANPNDVGSGGGGGGAGGGAVHLTVSGVLQVDGEISADGISPAANGGGSGGSVYLSAPMLTGSGLISAKGGAGATEGGGGGGGRIAIYTILPATFTNLQVNGGAGFNPGGPGTIFFGNF